MRTPVSIVGRIFHTAVSVDGDTGEEYVGRVVREILRKWGGAKMFLESVGLGKLPLE